MTSERKQTMNDQTNNQTNSQRKLARNEKGLSTVEYIIILVLIAVAGISLWQEFGDVLTEKISGATAEVEGL
jgi:Flp pilus assembly pilin Flp